MLYNGVPVSYISIVGVNLLIQWIGQTGVSMLDLKGQFNNVSFVVILDSGRPNMRQLKEFGNLAVT